MISLVSSLVIRHPRAVVLGWLVLTAGLHYLAPPWDRITKDDDLGLFPADSPSVIGQELLERGFPQDASSSDLVLIYERKNGRLTPDDFRFVDGEASSLSQFAQEHPELGVNKIDTYRSPVIGPRLISSSADSPNQAVLSVVSLNSTHLSQKTQVAVDQILEWLNTDKPAPPSRLRRVITGSAAVGHDTNAATNESIQNTTHTTIVLVILILLVVYRSPLLAMVPLVTIALSVFASLRLIALLTEAPGLGFQVINITQIFVVVVLFGAGTDYCLFLVARYREELGRGGSRVEALREAIRQVGAAHGRQCSDGDRRAGDALVHELRHVPVHRADDRAEPCGGAGRGLDVSSRDAGVASRRALLALPGPPSRGWSESRDRESRGAPPDRLLGRSR